MQDSLPIYSHQEAIIAALQQEQRVLLNAPTGSGKSTGIPPILYEADTIEGQIIIVQPRRLAARLLAQRVAHVLGKRIGHEVGYAVRFEAKFTPQTKILFLTDGVLLRQMAENPSLHGIGLIIFDEFHERRIASDVALGYCTDLQQTKRPDLKLIVMSATLAEDSLEKYLAPCAKINAEGRAYPVEISHRAPRPKNNPRTGRPETPLLWEHVKELSREISSLDDCGNWLVFMPGAFEIRKTVETLSNASWLSDYEIFPLYSSLPPKQQMEALDCPRPKIIVATNVAETSLTIAGVKTVIDTGTARESRYDPTRDMDSLLIRKISQASATQRAGRAGRTAPGICYRLWSEPDQQKREPFQLPEALRLDLAPTILLLAKLGYTVESFPWLETPPKESIARALALLQALGALNTEGTLTEKGEQLSQLPLPPRLARLVLAGIDLDCLPETLFVAGLLQGESFVKRTSGLQNPNAHRARRSQNSISDFEERHDPSSFAGLYSAFAYAKVNKFSPQAAKPFGLSLRALRELDSTIQQLQSRIGTLGEASRLRAEPDFHSRGDLLAKAVALTFPDRLCQRLGSGTLSARLIGNRKGKLEDSTPARQGTLFFATEIQEIQGRDVLTHLSGLIKVETDQLAEWFPDRITTKDEVNLDEVTNKFVNQELSTYNYGGQSLQISHEISPNAPDSDQVAALMSRMIIEGEAELPKWNYKVEQWIARLNQLAEWMPELELPPIGHDDRAHLIQEICTGATRLKELKHLDPWPMLNDWLSPMQAQALASYAPTDISLSNGTKTQVTYAEGEPPTIAVKLQRLYDVRETPALCNNTVPLRVQILAPNQRPWQITSDLQNFWENGYPQMKKDLAGRYPKHEWR